MKCLLFLLNALQKAIASLTILAFSTDSKEEKQAFISYYLQSIKGIKQYLLLFQV